MSIDVSSTVKIEKFGSEHNGHEGVVIGTYVPAFDSCQGFKVKFADGTIRAYPETYLREVVPEAKPAYNPGDKVRVVEDTRSKYNDPIAAGVYEVADSGSYTTPVGWVLVKSDSFVNGARFVKDSLVEPVEAEPAFKILDRVQVKQGAQGFHESWYGKPGVLHNNPEYDPFVDYEHPYMVVYEDDGENEFVWLQNLDALEPADSDVTEAVEDDEPDYSNTYVVVTNVDGTEDKYPFESHMFGVDENGAVSIIDLDDDMIAFYPAGQFKRVVIKEEK